MVRHLDEKTIRRLQEPPDKEVIDSHSNWFEMEVRLRKLVHKLLKPVVARNIEDRQLNLKNEKNLKFSFEKLQEMQKYLFVDR